MPEVWLRSNCRALALGLILPALIGLAAAVGLLWAILSAQPWYWELLFFLLLVPSLWLFGGLMYALSKPRLAYEAGQLLVYLEPARPTEVPIDIVECFFLGQGASDLPKLRGREPETQNVVVRLAESATDWKHREVRPPIGHWCEGYITIRGSWCEPIDRELMQRLNRRLAEVQRERKVSQHVESQP